MNSDILDFIKEIPEKPTKTNLKELAISKGFNINYLRSGGSRHIIEIIGTDYLIKLAFWEGGLIQNENECNPLFREYKELYNIPLAWNKSYSAILVQKLNAFDELDYQVTFPRIFNLTAQELYDYVQIIQLKLNEDVSYYENKITSLGILFIKSWINLHNTSDTILYNSELPGDYAKSDSYGRTKAGCVKIIDFGHNEVYYSLRDKQ